MRAMILQLAAEYPEDVGTNFDSLELTWSPFLEKNLDVLIDCISDLQAEQNENGKWLRQVGRLQQQQQQFLQKRVSLLTYQTRSNWLFQFIITRLLIRTHIPR